MYSQKPDNYHFIMLHLWQAWILCGNIDFLGTNSNAAFPSATIFDGKDVVFEELLSSGGLPIWAKGDPVHLTPTAYGDVAAALMNKLKSTGGENQMSSTKKQTESIVTWVQNKAKETPTPGWILGDCMTATRGCGGRGRFWKRRWPTRHAAWLAGYWRQPVEPLLNKWQCPKKKGVQLNNCHSIS